MILPFSWLGLGSVPGGTWMGSVSSASPKMSRNACAMLRCCGSEQ